jgi:endonuclease VIII
MEGPSLVIAKEEFSPFLRGKLKDVEGNAKFGLEKLEGAKFVAVESWGKHFLLSFETGRGKKKEILHLRIHFLMFGSYRIDNPRENRFPRMAYSIGKTRFYFYSCGIRPIDQEVLDAYDWSIDLMSRKWNHKQAVQSVKAKSETMICDVLMDQNIFAGLGNIIKNEVLYRLLLHPELKVKDLTPKQLDKLVSEAHNYSHQFYEWKKINQLKRHWLIFRKKDCPFKHGKLVKEPTGKLQRFSHYCPVCQPKKKRKANVLPGRPARTEKRITGSSARH